MFLVHHKYLHCEQQQNFNIHVCKYIFIEDIIKNGLFSILEENTSVHKCQSVCVLGTHDSAVSCLSLSDSPVSFQCHQDRWHSSWQLLPDTIFSPRPCNGWHSEALLPLDPYFWSEHFALVITETLSRWKAAVKLESQMTKPYPAKMDIRSFWFPGQLKKPLRSLRGVEKSYCHQSGIKSLLEQFLDMFIPFYRFLLSGAW